MEILVISAIGVFALIGISILIHWLSKPPSGDEKFLK